MDDETRFDRHSPLQLTSDELADLAHVIEKGRAAGWLAPREVLLAERKGALVNVRRRGGKRSAEYSYKYSDRWIVDLIRDLAAGVRAPGHDEGED